MVDIKSEFLAQLDQLEDAKRHVIADREAIEAERSKLHEEQKQLDESKKTLEKAVADAGGLAEIDRLRQELAEKLAQVEKELITAKEKRLELLKWENRLVEIETRHNTENDKMLRDRLALDENKRDYKAKLKAEFLEEVKRALPQ